MGSNYYGEQNYFGGNERGMMFSSSSSSSSRKGKKSSSDKPKQPQRGLGVAQLEKIRLHSEIGCTLLPSLPHNPYASNYTQEDVRLQSAHSSSFSYSSSSSPPYGYQGHHGMVMGLPDLDRANVGYGDSQSTNITRWHPGNAGYGTQHFVEPSMTRSFFDPALQGNLSMNKKDDSDTDVDLELRLSL